MMEFIMRHEEYILICSLSLVILHPMLYPKMWYKRGVIHLIIPHLEGLCDNIKCH